jgi:hypothetical protein
LKTFALAISSGVRPNNWRFLMRRLVCVIAAVVALYFSSRLAEAETKTFDNPTFGGDRLDWCVNWGEGCGGPAATAWCKTVGFDEAIDSKQAPDIGASTPTRLIATREICDQSYCDGFTSITCATVAAPLPAPPPAPIKATETPSTPEAPPVEETADEMFRNPMLNDVRLNWCFDGDSGCGKKAAEAWCAQQEFRTAKDFKYVSGIKSTIQIGTGKTAKKAAKAFSRVTCVK